MNVSHGSGSASPEAGPSPEARPSPEAGPAAQTAATPAHVLIVDDLEVNRELLARRVRRLGHSHAFAHTGREALRALHEAAFDLVLLDITMPDMDGYEALARIKADPRLRHVPVVMVSAIDGLESVVRCLDLGADDYITKPFNPVLLRARIESSLTKKRVADLNARLLQSLSREMAIAERIQMGFLPERLPQIAGWPMAASCTPARQVGGDFYDAMTLADGRLAFVLADVCDKGVGAALYMGLFRSLLRISLQQAGERESADQVLVRAMRFTNDYIATVHGRDNMFATVFAAILDPGTGDLHVVNAGHDAPMLWRARAPEIERLSPGGPALGMMAGVAHEAQCTRLQAGDRLLVFSDGLPEARSPQGQPFGERSLPAQIASAPTPESLIDTLSRALAAHAGDEPAHDDVTMLCLFAGAG
ncbi:MAG: SpoIIE family protein phosphatase [Burkholderiaceae bacterium]